MVGGGRPLPPLRQSRGWSLALHGGSRFGAAAMASSTRPSMELQQHMGRFVECSNSYERVPNIVFGMYKCSRRIRAHRAVARPWQGHRGLVAGCALAKGILKAIPAESPSCFHMGRPRDHVDDIALQIDAGCPGECVAQTEALGSLKDAMVADIVALNAGKQQVSGITQAARRAWEAGGGEPQWSLQNTWQSATMAMKVRSWSQMGISRPWALR